MLGGLLKGMVDVVGMTTDKIQDSLESTAKELGCTYKELFYTIAPCDEDFNFKCYIYKFDGGTPKVVREITVKQIVEAGEKED